MQQGTGKTITSLAAIARWWRKQSVKTVLVICPKSAIGVWIRQIKEHLNVPYCITILERRIEIQHPPRGIHFVIVNYEKTWRFDLPARHWDVVICDEIHRISRHNSRQSEACARIAKLAERRLGLTGTPTESGEEDLWGIMRFINPSILGDNWQRFRNQYMRKAGFHRYEYKMKKHMVKPLLDKVAPNIIRIRAKEMLDLPPSITQMIPFKLTGEASRVYRELEKDLVSSLHGSTVATPRRVTQMIRLQQVTGGFLHTDEGAMALEQDKLGVLYDWLLDYPKNKKLIVFCRFTHEIDAIYSTLKSRRSTAILDGRNIFPRTIWQDFQDKRDPNTLILQSQVGSESIDLFAASTAILYSTTWSWRQYDQAKKRLDRHGQKEKMRFLHLVGKNTIDEDIVYGLGFKDRANNRILQHLSRRYRHG